MADQQTIQQVFGIVLRSLRERKGWSQEELAFECELDRTFISMLERGVRQPTLTSIFVIAEALEVKPSRLLGKVERLL